MPSPVLQYTFGQRLIAKFSQRVMPLLSLFLLSHKLNTWVWRMLGAKVGKGSIICIGSKINTPFNVTIGKKCWIHGNFLARGTITIGDFVELAENVTVSTQARDIHSERFKPVYVPVIIEDRCFISINTTILQGVTVGRGAVVAAGAVVTKNVEPWTVVAGIPAKEIGKREKLVGEP